MTDLVPVPKPGRYCYAVERVVGSVAVGDIVEVTVEPQENGSLVWRSATTPPRMRAAVVQEEHWAISARGLLLTRTSKSLGPRVLGSWSYDPPPVVLPWPLVAGESRTVEVRETREGAGEQAVTVHGVEVATDARGQQHEAWRVETQLRWKDLTDSITRWWICEQGVPARQVDHCEARKLLGVFTGVTEVERALRSVDQNRLD